MKNPINAVLNRAVRQLTLAHINAVDVAIYRKAGKDAGNDPQTIGGAMELGMDDEAEYQIDLLGAAKMLHTERLPGSEHAGEGFTYADGQILVNIEPVIESEFEVQKYDRVYQILPNMTIAYQVLKVISPTSLPGSRTTVYLLQPLEQQIYSEGDERY